MSAAKQMMFDAQAEEEVERELTRIMELHREYPALTIEQLIALARQQLEDEEEAEEFARKMAKDD